MSQTAVPLRIEIIDPLIDAGPHHAAETVGVAAEAVPLTDYGAEFAAAVHAWTVEKSEPAVRATRVVHRRVAAVLHVLGRRRDQLMFDGNPRRDSRVKQHVFATFAEIEHALPPPHTVIAAGRAELVTTTEFRPRAKGGVSAEGSLRLPWSWPAIPVSITVEPWWRSQTVATIELRNRRRWRYPRRYFRAAHSVVRTLRDSGMGLGPVG